MKNSIIYLLVISFLLQSCYSYRAISLKETPLIVDKNYKIKQEDKFIKAKLKIANDSVINVVEGKVEKDIYVNNIKEIKVRKFSVLKTVGLSLGVILVGGLIAIAASGPILGDSAGTIIVF
jgi:hypothetical protein